MYVDKLSSSTTTEIKAEADRLCQSLNRGNSINVNKTGSDPLNIAWDYYSFDCKKSQSEAGKLDQVEIASLIEKSKTTCKELGFKEETEKFNDCKLKIYTQLADAEAATKAAKSTNRGQTIIVGPPRPYPKVTCDVSGGLLC